MARKSISRGIIRDLIIVAVGIILVWVSLQAVFGTQNPFYVVASGSMVPELAVYDVLIVQGHAPFDKVVIGDIIVFNRPSDHDRVIVHRVVSIIGEDPTILRTKGDANSASIPGTDFPITEKEYIGTVAYVIPQVGYVTQILKPPVNYIIIILVVGIMVAKQVFKKRNEVGTEEPERDYSDAGAPGEPGVDAAPDPEYTKHQNTQDAPPDKNAQDIAGSEPGASKDESSSDPRS